MKMIFLAIALMMPASDKVETPSIEPDHSMAETEKPAGRDENVATPDQAPQGIRLALTEPLSSKTHVKGDTFTMKVVEDFVVDDVVVLPAGTEVIGEITLSKTKRFFGGAGKLDAKLLYAVLPGGTLRLDGGLNDKGKDASGAALLGYALVSGFAYFITGTSAAFPAGTEVLGHVRED